MTCQKPKNHCAARDAFKEALAINPSMPAVPYFFSTGSSITSIKDGYRGQDVLKKPFTFEQLVNMLSGSLRHQTNVIKLRH